MAQITIDFGDNETAYQLLKGIKKCYRRELVSLLVTKTADQYGTNAFSPKSIHGLIDIIRDSGSAPVYQIPAASPPVTPERPKKRPGTKKTYPHEPVYETFKEEPVSEVHQKDNNVQYEEPAPVHQEPVSVSGSAQEQSNQSTISSSYVDYITGGFYDDPNQQL